MENTYFSFVPDEILSGNASISQAHGFYSYFPSEDDFYNRVVYEFPSLALSVTGYNILREMAGLDTISLSDNEYTVQWYATATDDEISDFLSEHAELKVAENTFTPSITPTYIDNLGEYIYNDYTTALFVLPDWVCEDLMKANYNFVANTDTAMSYQDAITLQNSIGSYASSLLEDTGLCLST